MAKGRSHGSRPWLTIWTTPRRTIREIVDHDPRYGVLLIYWLATTATLLGLLSGTNTGERQSVVFIFALAGLAGAVLGPLCLYVRGAIFCWTGKWFGGCAPASHVRAAIAWSHVPYLCSWGVKLIQVPVFGAIVFTRGGAFATAYPDHLWLVDAQTTIQWAVAAWGVVVSLLCMAEVQKYSLVRALGHSLVASLLYALARAPIHLAARGGLLG